MSEKYFDKYEDDPEEYFDKYEDDTSASAPVNLSEMADSHISGAIETVKDGFKSFQEGPILLGPLAKRAGDYAASGLMGLTGRPEGEDFLSTAERLKTERKQEQKERHERSPYASGIASFLPNITVGGVGPKAATIGGAVGRIASETALDAADSVVDEKKVDPTATLGIMTALESIPVVGRGIKTLMPGTEGASKAVNEITASIGGWFPGSNMDRDELLDLLSKPQERRSARQLMKPGATEEIAENATEILSHTADESEKMYRGAFGRAKRDWLQSLGPGDLSRVANLGEIGELTRRMRERPELFSRAKPLVRNMNKILTKGSESEFGRATEGLGPKALRDTFGPDTAARVMGNRVVEARKYLGDNQNKKVVWESLLTSDQNMLTAYRRSLNNLIEGAGDATALRQMDEFTGRYLKADANAFDKLRYRAPGDGPVFTPEKTLSYLKSGADQSKFIDRGLKEFAEVMQTIDRGEAKLIHESINELREQFKMLRRLELLTRSGGPTFQINNAWQAVMAGMTGFASLAIYPATNPAGWLRLIDSLDEHGKKLAKKAFIYSSQIHKDYPAYVARITSAVVGKEDADQEPESLSQSDSWREEYGITGDIERQPPVKEEGFFDILKMIKDPLIEKAKNAGAPGWATTTAEVMLPDSVLPSVGGAGAVASKMLKNFKLPKLFPADTRPEVRIKIADQAGNNDQRRSRAEKARGDRQERQIWAQEKAKSPTTKAYADSLSKRKEGKVRRDHYDGVSGMVTSDRDSLLPTTAWARDQFTAPHEAIHHLVQRTAEFDKRAPESLYKAIENKLSEHDGVIDGINWITRYYFHERAKRAELLPWINTILSPGNEKNKKMLIDMIGVDEYRKFRQKALPAYNDVLKWAEGLDEKQLKQLVNQYSD